MRLVVSEAGLNLAPRSFIRSKLYPAGRNAPQRLEWCNQKQQKQTNAKLKIFVERPVTKNCQAHHPPAQELQHEELHSSSHSLLYVRPFNGRNHILDAKKPAKMPAHGRESQVIMVPEALASLYFAKWILHMRFNGVAELTAQPKESRHSASATVLASAGRWEELVAA